MYNGVYPNYLYHHGILGMKWGKRNGPPYPLAPSAHSASERKAGWRQSLDGGAKKVKEGASRAAGAAKSVANKAANKVGLDTDAKRKKAIKVGLAIAGTALAAYGTYKASEAIARHDYYKRNYPKYMDTILKTWGPLEASQIKNANDTFRSSANAYAKSNNVFARTGRAIDDATLGTRMGVTRAVRGVGRNIGDAARDASDRARTAIDDATLGTRMGVTRAVRGVGRNIGDAARDASDRVGYAVSSTANRAKNSELGKAAGRAAERAGVAVRGAASRAIDRQNERAEARRQAGVELSSRAADYASRAGRDYQPGRDERRLATLERAERVGSAVAKVTSPLRSAARAVGSAASSARNSELGKAAGRTAERAGVAARKAASNAIDRSNERARQREVDRQAAAVERERKRQEREARRRR